MMSSTGLTLHVYHQLPYRSPMLSHWGLSPHEAALPKDEVKLRSMTSERPFSIFTEMFTCQKMSFIKYLIYWT